MTDHQPPASTETYHLSDGSTAVIEHRDRHALVSRYVDDLCVWGQAFSTHPEDHAARCLTGMQEDPAAYDRRPLWDPITGAAVRP